MINNVISIETASELCSIVLKVGEKKFDFHESIPKLHTQVLLPQIEILLNKANITINEINLIAFGHGPGSFTGVRIATSFAQGMAFGLDVPVIGVSSLRAIAQSAYLHTKKTKVCALIDARMNEFYWGLYELDPKYGVMVATSKEQVTNLKNIEEVCPKDYTMVLELPNAHQTLLLAEHEYNQGNQGAIINAMPKYIRNNVVQ